MNIPETEGGIKNEHSRNCHKMLLDGSTIRLVSHLRTNMETNIPVG